MPLGGCPLLLPGLLADLGGNNGLVRGGLIFPPGLYNS